ncbi:GDSL esterase/lipase EXL3-like [Tripterygium wilfordii]|uniref:GDSL esterase/lipase EXL3-like n=1 Tax=Tripterygium wilfordii TaxID=458696 RepID=UPI0018F7F4D3|nr:GDSL esterase/lipase EXL3-like [Tripterygium wilfordii]
MSKSSSTSLTLVFFLVGLFSQENGAAALNLLKKGRVPAIIAFGDSIVDPGNNNYLTTIVRSNFPPYGRDFIGGKPTGRFSNGKIPTDLLAEAFGIKDLLPAYLDPNLTIRDLHTGVSFASAGSGYDPLTAKLVSVLSLSDQLHLFKDYLRKIKHVMGEETMGRILAKGIFIVCAGGDDIVNTYFPTLFRIIDHDIHSYTDLMVKSASSFYQFPDSEKVQYRTSSEPCQLLFANKIQQKRQELHKLGVRRIGVFGVSTMGCLPSQRTTRGGIQRKCSASENQASQIFNSKLSSEIDVLNENLVDLKLVYFDSYHSLLHLVSNPSQYGNSPSQ